MSLQFVIDGYNIIHHPKFNRASTKRSKDPRLALLEFIKITCLCGSANNKIMVIFDGYPPADVNFDIGAISVIFSRKISADEKIKKIVEETANRKSLIVVSDDRGIIFSTKSCGANPLGVDEFFSRNQKSKKIEEDVSEPKLGYAQMEEINRELRKIWLS